MNAGLVSLRCSHGVHAQLKSEAEANLRSLNQEAIIRIQRSFDVADRFSTEAVNQLIDEALTSGEEETLTKEQLRERFERTREHTRFRLASDNRGA